MIFVTSDTHFFHDREFVWKKRGFENVDEMNEVLVENWNRVVSEKDTVYHLGDVFLGVGTDYEKAGELLYRLHGQIHLVTGNHDQEPKLAYLQEHVPGVVFHRTYEVDRVAKAHGDPLALSGGYRGTNGKQTAQRGLLPLRAHAPDGSVPCGYPAWTERRCGLSAPFPGASGRCHDGASAALSGDRCVPQCRCVRAGRWREQGTD